MSTDASSISSSAGVASFQSSTGSVWRELIRAGDLVFDIGANFGHKAASFLELGARVVCIEPQPRCVAALRQRFAAHSSLEVVPMGLADRVGKLPFSICSDKDYLSTFSTEWKKGRFADEQWDQTVQVEVTTLDEIIRTHGRPRFCKIDVEGYELPVLQGLSEPVPFLSFEFAAEFTANARACLVRLNQLGYRHFNFSAGESHEFDFGQWVSAQALLEYLGSQSNPLFWGDIYARMDQADQSLPPTAPELPSSALWASHEAATGTDDLLRRLQDRRITREIECLYQVGAHCFEERAAFLQLFPKLQRCILFEPNPELFKKLQDETAADPMVRVLPMALSDTDGSATFHIANNDGHSSSLLPLGRHQEIFPDVAYDHTITVQTHRLPSVISSHQLPVPDLLFIDTQGAEYKILTALDSELRRRIKLIYVEASLEEVYAGSLTLDELRVLLEPDFQFLGYAPQMPETPTHGNALFINQASAHLLEIETVPGSSTAIQSDQRAKAMPSTAVRAGAVAPGGLSEAARGCVQQSERFLQEGRPAMARDWLERALDLAPEHPDLLSAFGSLAMQLGDFTTAADTLNRAISHRPDDAALHALLASAYLSNQQIDAFERALARSLEIDPNEPSALRLLADLNFQHNRFPDSARAYGALFSAGHGGLEILLPLGVCFRHLNDLDAARECFEEVLRQQPGHEIASRELAQLQTTPPPALSSRPDGLISDSLPEPVVTVIVSTYNSERFMAACLRDLVAQTILEKLEILVIDSGSQENERKIVEQFQLKHSNIRYIRTDREPLYVAWNRAVKLARGRFVVNANTDDSRRPDAFQILLEAMEAHPDADLAYAHFGMSGSPNDQFPPKGVFRNVRHDPYHPGQLLFYCITGCLQFWRKSALEKIGGFDESLKCVADYEILLRFMRQGMKPLLVPEILSTFFINQKGLSFGSDTAFKEDKRIKEDYRNAVQAEEIYVVDSSGASEMVKAWINLGNMAASFPIPWDDNPHSCPEYAIYCYQKAVALDASCRAAWHNLAVLSIRMGITAYLSTTFRAAQNDIDEIIADARLNPEVIGFDLPKRVQGYYFQRPGVKKEVVASAPIAPKKLSPQAVETRGLAISWEGSFLDLGSLSHINRELTDRLCGNKEFKVVTIGVNAIPPSVRHNSEWKRRARKLHAEPSGHAAVTVRHQWPPDWSRPTQGALVVIQPWEFGSLPQEWVKASAQVDEFWVPSNYVRAVYVSSGVDASKVQVIPNGVDTRRYRPEAKPIRLDTRKSFKFLFVGGTIGRKGPDVLLEAYIQSFTAADDVCLVIKDFGGSGVYQGLTMGALIEQARQQPNAPEILHLTQELSPEQMPGLFTACDCLVHPYRGEGFGLPILEAMSCGRPVIVTRGGAADDFVSKNNGWLIDSQRRSIGNVVSKIPLVAEGWLLEPDVNHLAALLRLVVANPIEAKSKGEAGARLAREKYEWSTVTSLVADRLKIVAQLHREKATGTSGAQPMAKGSPKRALPPCAVLGQVDQAKGFFAKKDLAEAWRSACAAIKERPFNPPAWHLLWGIALAAHDFGLARKCLETLRTMAPAWKPAKDLANKLAGRKDGPSSGFKLPVISTPPRLSVCLIVKNEEKFLGACLKSVQGLTDQIIVVDTGSQDRTIEIARERGAEVHTFEWCDDFSAARNVALEHATGDWILVLDADEELSPAGRAALLEELRANSVMAYRLPITDAGRAGEGCNYVPRLFRNAPSIHFSGRIHEHAFGAVEVLRQEWGLDNCLGKAELIHHGYTAAVTRGRDKVARNRRLLELALEESPDDANLLMNLGLELVRSNELAAGVDKYFTALRMLSSTAPSSVVPELRESLLTQLCTHLLSAGRFNEIVATLHSPLAMQTELTASLHYILGLALMELKHHQAAVDQFRLCLSKRNQLGLTSLNPEIHKAAPHHCLGMCLIAMQQLPMAEQALRGALVDEPRSVPVRLDLARLWVSQRRAVDALTLLHEMISENSGDARIWLLGGGIALGQPAFLEFAMDWTGEAVRYFPRDREIALQRAESLLLSGKLELARPLFRVHRESGNLRSLAALALIELIADSAEPCFSIADQAAVGREFLLWYRRLLAFEASSVIEQINARLPQLRRILPSAAAALESALEAAVA